MKRSDKWRARGKNRRGLGLGGFRIDFLGNGRSIYYLRQIHQKIGSGGSMVARLKLGQINQKMGALTSLLYRFLCL